MISAHTIFWNVDTQADFMLPGGKLYVPDAEKLLPNINRLTDAARNGNVFIVSDACIHSADDEEFAQFPPHCLRGTPGADVVPESLAVEVVVIPNREAADLPANLAYVQQVILEKQTLDVFDNPNTETVIERLKSFTDPDAEFAVFGVVTEYCVRLAAKGLLERGRRVALIRDCIETLDPQSGRHALDELTGMGARLITTDEALALVEGSSARYSANQNNEKLRSAATERH